MSRCETIGGVSRVSSPVFVGRTAELASLQAGLAAAHAGEGRAVFVGGEAGVGKTRLIREFAATMSDEHLLIGGCIDVDGGVPFAPFVEGLRSLLRSVGEDHLLDLAGPTARELRRLLPELGSRTDDPGPGVREDQTRIFEVVFGLLDRLGTDRPVVVVCEDIHWADQSTRDLLAYLVHNARASRLLLAATYRTDELHRRHPLRPLLAEVERSDRADRIEVSRFGRDELAALLAGILDGDPDVGLVDAVYARSEGNAFFAEELLAASEGRATGELPGSLRDILLVRIERLPDETQEVLRTAAAAGPQTHHRLLAAVAQRSERDLAAALREAVAQQVLETDDDGAYTFRHALLREAVYEDLLPGERVELHAAFAGALEADPSLAGTDHGGLAAVVAHHWYAAHELERAFVASVDAGLAAQRAWAFGDARLHFERALELWSRVPNAHDKVSLDHPDLLLHVALAEYLIGDTAHAATVIEQALTEIDPATDPGRASHFLERRGRCLWTSGYPHDALQAYEEALALCPATPPTVERARALASSGQAMMLLDRNAEAIVRCRDAIEVARAVGDRAIEGHATNTVGTSLGALGHTDEAVELLQAAAVIADEVRDADDRLRADVNLSEIFDIGARTEEGLKLAVDSATLSRQLGLHRSYGSYLLANAARFCVRLGRWDEADEFCRQANAFTAQPLAELRTHAVQGMLLLRRGEFAAARAEVDAAATLQARAMDVQHAGIAVITEAELAMLEGRYDDVIAIATRGMSVAGASDDQFYTPPLCTLAVAASEQLGRSELATPFLDWLERAVQPGGEAIPAPLTHAERANAVAIAAALDGRDASINWSVAAARWAEVGDVYREAGVRMRWAAALAAEGTDTAAVTAMLREAWDTANRLQAAPFLEQVEATARRLRITLANVEHDPALGLTAREREVVTHLVEGRTNRQIAEALFISEKTASVHVSNILTKLGAANRGQAAAVARRLGLG
jgi:DNA-binding CsgD family transcriptional regulator